MSFFDTIAYLEAGNPLQQAAFAALNAHAVMEQLAAFDPVLVGTIPIDIAIATSDLDIVCCWQDAEQFAAVVQQAFERETAFSMRRTLISGEETIIAHFRIGEFEVEVFGQRVAVRDQAGYRHLLAEHRILQERGEAFRLAVIALKEQGMKTEPAFGKLLGLTDPYRELLER